MREYVSQFREYLTEKKAVSQNTLQSYMRDIQHFLTFMKEHQFTDLLKADDTMMHLYVEELTRQNLSNATITRRLASIRCFYQFLMQNYHVTVNPAKHIKLEKSPKKLPHFLSGAEIDCCWHSRTLPNRRDAVTRQFWNCFMQREFVQQSWWS